MFRRALVLATIIVKVVFGQGLPGPTGTHGAEDAFVLLARAREKVLSSTRRMPKYTCLETINREYYIQPVKKHSPRAMTEAPAHLCTANHSAPLSLDAADRLRVEVAEAGVRAKGSQEVLVPAGAITRGRLLELGYQFSTSEFVISIRFDTLEMNGAVSPLSVRLDQELKIETRTGTAL